MLTAVNSSQGKDRSLAVKIAGNAFVQVGLQHLKDACNKEIQDNPFESEEAILIYEGKGSGITR